MANSEVKMISGQKMQSIAQLVRMMSDPLAKKYVCDNWGRLRELSKKKDDKWADELIDTLLTEKIDKIADFI